MTPFLDRIIAASDRISGNPLLNGFVGILNGLWLGAMLGVLWLMDPMFALAIGAVCVVIMFVVHTRALAVATVASAVVTIVAGAVFFST